MTGNDAENFKWEQPTEPTLGKQPDFREWLSYGVKMGWCGPAVCYTHDGLPTTEAEDDDWGAGLDPCIHVIRMYEDGAVKEAVEQNHSPSNWRKTGQVDA